MTSLNVPVEPVLRKRILIVDDQPMIRQFLTTLLGYKGFETVEAENGAEALAMVNTFAPDLVIADIAMPVMDGLEFARNLRVHRDAIKAATPVIFYTATYLEKEARRLAAQCGVDHVLAKPASPDVILAIIASALGTIPAPGERVDNSGAVDELHAAREKLAALIEFNIDLSADRDRTRVLDKFVRAARRIIGAGAAVACVFDSQQQLHCATPGDGERLVRDLESLGLPVLEGSLVSACMGDQGNSVLENVLKQLPYVRTYLTIPMNFSGVRRGCLLLINRENGQPFGDGDRTLAMTVALQASQVFDNLTLYDETRAALSRTRRFFESNMIGVFDWSIDGGIHEANDAFLEMVGSSRSEVAAGALRWTDLTPEEWRAADAVALEEIARKGVCTPIEKEYFHRDGRRIPILIGAAVFEDDSRRGVCFVIDLSERKAADRERNALARERELLLNSAVEGVYVLDPEGRCTIINNAALRMFDRRAEEVAGRPLHPLVHHTRADGTPCPVESCPMYAVTRSGIAVRKTDEVFWRRDGTSFPVEYSASPLMDEGVIRGAVVMFSDVTARRQLEWRLEQANRVEGLGRVAATIAHEFNNVLMGIQPFAEIISLKAGTDPSLVAAAGHIVRSVKRGRRVTQEILRFTNPAAPVLKPVNVGEVVSGVIHELDATLGGEVSIEFDPGSQSLSVLCERTQLEQVVTNLILNARDAMSGNGTIRVRTHFSAGCAVAGTRLAVREHHACIEVCDSGSGIDAANLEKVFEPLYTTKRSGTGLGLAVVRQIAVRHGGEVGVESRPGEGARFHVMLPLAETVATVPAPPYRQEVSRPSARILLVEDDSTIAAGLRDLLEGAGHLVHHIGEGRFVGEAIEGFAPHAMILDVSLPDCTGIEVFDRIALRWKDLPVVFASGHTERGILTPYLGQERVRFIQKPFEFDALVGLLNEVLPSGLGA